MDVSDKISFNTNELSLGGEGYLRIISEVEDYAIFILDKEGTIITWNKGAEKIKGYKGAEIIGQNYRIFYPKEDKDAGLPEKILREAFVNRRTNHEGWRVRKDGTRFWGMITLTAIHNDAGEITGYLKMTRDLTERKLAEDRINNYLEDLKQKNEALKKSEDRYHRMVDEVKDYAIILLDREGNILDWNQGAAKLKGYSTNEILGKSVKLFYAKEDKESNLPQRLLDEAVVKGSVNHEGWRIKKDGTRFWGNVTITAIHDDEGKIIGFSKVTRDLTARKKADEVLSNVAEELRLSNLKLRQSEERYHKMIAEVQDYAIIFLNPKGAIENWNTGAQVIKGYTAEEALGKHFSIFYTDEDRENNLPEKVLELAARNGKSIHEGWRVRKNGTKFWGSVVVTALHDSYGKIIGFSKVTRDLTDKKHAEDALKETTLQLHQKNRMLEKLNNELSSFTYVASHDLKEPLRKIQTFSERLENLEDLSPTGRSYLDKISGASARMRILIDDLLSYSQISNDDSNFENVDLNAVLKSVQTDLELPIYEKKATIRSEKLPTIHGVSFQLYQLFLNLLSNSLKFAKPSSPPSIEVSAKIVKHSQIPQNGTLNGLFHHISVRDNGIGFKQEYATKIFEVFQRLHPQHSVNGSGIGLAIVKKVVENHRGHVLAEGNPDEGTTIHLYLPYENLNGS